MEAIIIEAENPKDGFDAMMKYLTEKFGTNGEDWVERTGGIFRQYPPGDPGTSRYYVEMTIELSDGIIEKLFFDVGSFISHVIID